LQSIQDKLLWFARGSRRLLTSGLSNSDVLSVLMTVVMYPDVLTSSRLVIVQNIFDSVSTVSSLSDADIYLRIVCNIYAAGSILNVDVEDYVKNKLTNGVSFMISVFNQSNYYLYLNNIEIRLINSDDYFKQQLLSSNVPMLNFTMSLWAVKFFYNTLYPMTYQTTMYPYAIAL
jgi:hypothetical protein